MSVCVGMPVLMSVWAGMCASKHSYYSGNMKSDESQVWQGLLFLFATAYTKVPGPRPFGDASVSTFHLTGITVPAIEWVLRI